MMGFWCLLNIAFAGLNAIWITHPVNAGVAAFNMFVAGLCGAAWLIDRTANSVRQ